jgi:hypothetical protein
MTDDLEVQTDLSGNEEEDNKSSNNDDNVSELSLSSSPELNQEEEEIKDDEPPSELHDQIDEVLHIDEPKEENNLTEFITKARQQGFNCLDLSKKSITEFPTTLLEFPSLQVNFYI